MERKIKIKCIVLEKTTTTTTTYQALFFCPVTTSAPSPMILLQRKMIQGTLKMMKKIHFVFYVFYVVAAFERTTKRKKSKKAILCTVIWHVSSTVLTHVVRHVDHPHETIIILNHTKHTWEI